MTIAKAPTARELVEQAKAAGWTFKPAGKLNGRTAYKLENPQEHGYATDPFGRSAALFTLFDIARKLGYA